MNLRQLALAVATAVVAVGTAATQVVAQSPNAPPTPPPPGPNASATPGTLIGTPAPATNTAPPVAVPSSTPAPRGRRGRGAASPSPQPSGSESPAPPQFQSLDGVWELEQQPLDSSGRTVYSHLYVTQSGDNVSGTWARANSKQRIPFSGTFDGRLFNFTAKDGTTTYTMSGYAENFSDMVGLLKTTDPKDQGIPFTAQHRKKEKIGIGVQ